MEKIWDLAVMAMMILALFGAGGVYAQETDTLQSEDRAGHCIDRSGKGWALLAGSGKMNFRGKGLVVVLGSEPKIEKHGEGTIRRITPEMVIYRGKGKINVSGKKLAVYIRGEGRLRACGKGFVDMGGRGLKPVDSDIVGTLEAEKI